MNVETAILQTLIAKEDLVCAMCGAGIRKGQKYRRGLAMERIDGVPMDNAHGGPFAAATTFKRITHIVHWCCACVTADGQVTCLRWIGDHTADMIDALTYQLEAATTSASPRTP